MSYNQQHYSNVEELAPGMHFLRDELDCENLGITVVDVDGKWEGKQHDHADEGQEEVYLLMEGSGSLTGRRKDHTRTRQSSSGRPGGHAQTLLHRREYDGNRRRAIASSGAL